ncbi:MAG: phosphatidylglycerol:prolipoprotein diacylglycerol transferase, partial [Parvicellaceae bacterium]
FFVGYQILQKIFKNEGENLKKLDKYLIYTLIATVIGARLGHVFFYDWASYKDDLIRILYIREGGLASHGAVITIILASFIFSKRAFKGQSIFWLFDRVTIPVALACFFIRIGNLFNHEIMGKVTDGWGFKFLHWDGHPPYDQVDMATLPVRHPAQLYEAVAYLALFGVLWFLFYKKKAYTKSGLLFGVFFTFLFLARFLIEFVKEHQAETLGDDSFLTMGQWLSVPCIIIGVFFIVRSFKKVVPDRIEAYQAALAAGEIKPEESKKNGK